MDSRIHIPPEKRGIFGAFRIGVPVAGVHKSPRPSSPRQTELLYGEQFQVHKLRRGWAWGQAISPVPGSEEPGYVGYVLQRDLSNTLEDPTHQVSALGAPIFSKPNIKSKIIWTLPLNSMLEGSDQDGFLKIDTGYVHAEHVRELDKGAAPSDFVAVAESLLGQPYIWGGISSRGLDCSGLVLTALRATNKDAPRDSDMQAKMGAYVEIKPELSGLQRGDLVFWKGHVGIMQSQNQLLHANAFHMAVASEPLTKAVSRIEKSAGPITAIRRL